MNCHAYHAESATMRAYLKLAVSALCLLSLLAAAAPPASAHTVTFTYTCTDCQPTLYLATIVGGYASDVNTIATVQSDLSGPVPISGGLLTLQSSPATFVDCNGPGCGAEFGFRGGSAAIVGSVFGLSSGSTLLTAYFGPGAGDNYIIEAVTEYDGTTVVLYVNPTVLANLGLAGAPTVGSGNVSLQWLWDNNTLNWDGTLTVTFVPAGESAK